MKNSNYFYFFLIAMVAVFIVSCNTEEYKRTKSGIEYKIISGNSKDSTAKAGNIIKFNAVTKFKDSVLYTSYDKMPIFLPVPPDTFAAYYPQEVFNKLRVGDSAVVVSLYDSMLNKGMASQLPTNAKKGDKLISTLRVLGVFRNDSAYRVDLAKEMEKDKPRRQKEQADAIGKQVQQLKAFTDKEDSALRASGEIDKQIKVVKDYLASKNIKAQQTASGLFYKIDSLGEGDPITPGMTVVVKYTGKKMLKDSTFESNTYPLQGVGLGQVIRGWDEGLLLFKKGGKGTLYIPGYLAYGTDSRRAPFFKENEPLIFDIKIVDVKPLQ